MPQQKYCPKYFNLPALMAGSLTPDLGYYLHNWIWSLAGHSWLGSISFDLPAGLAITALFYLCIRPFSRLLPYPHREACSAVCPVVRLPDLRSLLVASVSVLIGAWTHIIWDGFTHANGWCVRELAPYTPTLFSLGDYNVTVWHLLQHGSTFLGLLLLFLAYSRFAHKKRFLKHQSLFGPKMLAFVWSLILLPSGIFAISNNVEVLGKGINIPSLDEFVFNATVTYICTFLPLTVFAGVLLSLLEYLFIPLRRPQFPAKAAAPAATLSSLPAIEVRQRILEVFPAPPRDAMPLPAEPLAKNLSN